MMRFTEWKLAKKRVFLRADLNVPITNGVIADDFRLLALRPTLDYLLLKGASVILATHCGRPKGYDPSLSTKPLAEWFSSRGYPITFVPYEPTGFVMPSIHQPGHIVLLDNVRFFDGEKKCEELFARMLRSYADYYINDAFGMVHEHAASTTLVPELFGKDHRSYGFLIKNEMVHLQFLKREEKKLTVLLSGGKGSDKIPSMMRLLDRQHLSVLVGPAPAFTFLKAQGKSVGKSLVNDELLECAHDILKKANKHHLPFVLPTDIMSSLDSSTHLITHNAHDFPENAYGITVGPQTLDTFKKHIKTADMIFCNGIMGFADQPTTLDPIEELFRSISSHTGYRVAGGGDTVALLRSMKIAQTFDFCSTGGGAALAVIAGEALPAIACLE